MHKLRHVINNTFISFLGQAITWISTLLLTIAYGRFLGAVKFGELYFAITFISLIGVPIEAGYSSQIIRDIAQEPGKALQYFSNIMLIKLVIWPLTLLFALGSSWLLGYTAEVRILVGISGFYLLGSAITGTLKSLHYAFERPIFPVVGTIIEKGLSAILGILLLRMGAGVEMMAVVMVIASFASGLWMAVWFFRRVGFSFTIDFSLIRQIVRTNIPFLIYGLMLVSYDRIDTVLLSLMTNSSVVGWYVAGIRIFDTLGFIPNLIIMTIMYPIFSKLSTASDEGLKFVVEKSINFMLFCSIPVTVLLIVAAPNVIHFLYVRQEFNATIPVLQALAPGLIFLFINFPISAILLSKKQDKKIPIMGAIALVFTVAANIILIPFFQHIGAAIVTALTEVLLFVVGIAFTPRHLLPLGSLRVGFKTLIASLVMALVILPMHELHILFILPVAIVVYLAAAVLLGTIPREDYQAIFNAIRQKVKPGTEATEETKVQETARIQEA